MAGDASNSSESPQPRPLVLRPSTAFSRDVKRQQKRGKKLSKLWAIVGTLRERGRLAANHKDHALAGDWKGWRDCHVEPDWILIYKQEGNELKLGRTGTHADLF